MAEQVQENDRRARYVVTDPAGQSVFDIDFPLEQSGDLILYLNGDAVGDLAYVVDLQALSVSLNTPAPEGSIVTLEGARQVKRVNGYPLRGDLESRRINYDMNSIIQMLQEMRRDISQAITVSKAEAENTVRTMPILAGNEGKALLVGAQGFELSTANFTDLDANLVMVEQAAQAVYAAKEDVDNALIAALQAVEDAEAAAEAAEDVVGFDGSAETVSFDGAGQSYISGENVQEALESVDDAIIAARAYVDDEIAAIPAPDIGAWVPIQTQTVTTAVSSVDFTSGIDGAYEAYVVVAHNLRPVNDSVILNARLGNGGTFDVTGYAHCRAFQNMSSSGSMGTNANSSASSIEVSSQFGNIAGEGLYGLIVYIHGAADVNTPTGVSAQFVGYDGSSAYAAGTSYGVRVEAAAHDRIRFFFSSGNIASGTFTLYGIKGA